MNWTILLTIGGAAACIANIYKKSWCWWAWAAVDVAWVIYNVIIGEIPQALQWGVYLILSIWGGLTWRNNS